MRTVHEKRRDHACPHCAAAFGAAINLAMHVRTVHKSVNGHELLLQSDEVDEVAQFIQEHADALHRGAYAADRFFCEKRTAE